MMECDVESSAKVLVESEEQARRLLEFQKKIIEAPLVWINMLDREGNITLWNRAAELISGYSREEVIGHKKVWEWLYPDSQYCSWNLAAALKLIETKGCVEKDDTTIRCKDGKLKIITWYSNSTSDENGNPSGSLSVGIDITERRMAESRLAMMNEKLRVVGGLTRHDAKNKLSAIVGNAYLAKKELSSNSKALNYLGEMETAVRQIVRIFDFAKNYEMLGVEELVYTDVEKTVNEAISLFSDLGEIRVINDCHGLTVFADSLLRQLFYNLIDNSLKYGRKISKIRLYCEKTGQNELRLIYEDDGIGIPAAEKLKLFKEGYSTGGGTGYGSYLIRKIVEVYGWTIQETGEEGKGAQFTITIPKISQSGKENYGID
jgi:PAS domain S-box-containing protein